MTEELSTKEAAEILQMDISSIQRLCRTPGSGLVCRYEGVGWRKTWFVTRASVDAYQKKIAAPRRGRPTGAVKKKEVAQ